MTPINWPGRAKRPRQTTDGTEPAQAPPEPPTPQPTTSAVTTSGARSIATGQSNAGINSSGDNTTNIQARHVTQLGGPGLRPVDQVPPARGVIGAPGAGQFVGRDAELTRLHTALTRIPDSGETPGTRDVVVQTLHGLGGIGKSALAARYTELHTADFTQILWITADSPANLETGLAEFAVCLEPELAGALPTEALRERAISWLCAHTGWLVILDNVTRPDDVRSLLARASTGRFLLTTRQATGWHNIATPLRLDVLHPQESRDLIAHIVGTDRTDLLTGVDDLCERLGHLPLALEQAAAYMHQNQLNAHDYADLLHQFPAAMLHQAAEGTTADRTIAQIWAITLNKLADTPLTGHLLRVLAWFAPDTIPRHYLGALAEPPQLHDALGKLAAYNMITLRSENVAVHRLVQAVSRTPDLDDPHRDSALIDEARVTANKLLLLAIPGEPDDPVGWPHWRNLIAHAEAYAQYIPIEDDTTETLLLIGHAAGYLENQGIIPQAIGYFCRALRASERIYGQNHSFTLSYRRNLARAYTKNGEVARAIPLLEQTIIDCEDVFGCEHPNTLAIRNDLTHAYRLNSELTRAIPLLQQTYNDYERILGPEHPYTLISHNNLATAYKDNGELTQALPLLQQILIDRERILGPEHPDTLTSRNNLATAYEETGDLTRAIPLFQQNLADYERIFGPKHPKTLTSRSNLASAYQETGDITQALPLFQQVLTDREHVLGPEHPDTLTSRNNLATAYGETGDLTCAIPLLEQVLMVCERVLPPRHSITKIVRDNLDKMQSEISRQPDLHSRRGHNANAD